MISVQHTIDELTVDFHWGRDRLFDQDLVQSILERCLENRTATIKKVISKPKSKWRPLPLDTIVSDPLLHKTCLKLHNIIFLGNGKKCFKKT